VSKRCMSDRIPSDSLQYLWYLDKIICSSPLCACACAREWGEANGSSGRSEKTASPHIHCLLIHLDIICENRLLIEIHVHLFRQHAFKNCERARGRERKREAGREGGRKTERNPFSSLSPTCIAHTTSLGSGWIRCGCTSVVAQKR
jgi:hypothetical protein